MQQASETQAVRGRWAALCGSALLPVVLAGGCSSLSNTDRGVLAGGGIGAGTGALVGSAMGKTGAGAAIGGVVGALAGGLTGSAIDESERRQDARVAAAVAAQQPPLGLQDVVQLTVAGSSDAVIINQIRTTGSVYHLSAQDILWLQNSGVREPVVREMQASAYRAPRRVYTAAPVQVVQPVYVVEPPPPVAIGFRYGRRW